MKHKIWLGSTVIFITNLFSISQIGIEFLSWSFIKNSLTFGL